MNKKPAVVAKTAKKRGRPAGVKNKPKPFKQVVVVLDDPVDWEKLAKQLQTALASEIKTNDDLHFLLSRKRTFFERVRCLFIGIA